MLNLGIPRNRGFLDVCRGKIAKPCLRDYLIADLGHVSGATSTSQDRSNLALYGIEMCSAAQLPTNRRALNQKAPPKRYLDTLEAYFLFELPTTPKLKEHAATTQTLRV